MLDNEKKRVVTCTSNSRNKIKKLQLIIIKVNLKIYFLEFHNRSDNSFVCVCINFTIIIHNIFCVYTYNIHNIVLFASHLFSSRHHHLIIHLIFERYRSVVVD